MKKVIAVVCIVALLVSLLSLAGCGMDGTYKMVEVIDQEGQSFPWEKESTLTINGKKATAFNLFGYQETIEYELDTETHQLVKGDTKMTYRIDSDRLELVNMNDVTLILKKQ